VFKKVKRKIIPNEYIQFSKEKALEFRDLLNEFLNQ
jgi:hypothetical protein